MKKNLPGIVVCFLIAIPAWFLGQWLTVVGGAVFAILFGMIITLFWKDKKGAGAGFTQSNRRASWSRSPTKPWGRSD